MYFAARHELSKSLRNRLSPQAPAASAKAPYGTPGMRAESQKSRVKAEKTKIFFQKASSGFGDVSFKERSGRFKA